MEQTAERIRFDFLPGLPLVVETQQPVEKR
jgi:hypothetical protein